MFIICFPFTLVGVQAKQGVLTAKSDTESPAGGRGALRVGDLHQVYVTVGGNEVHAAQRVRANAGLPGGGPHLVPELCGKLKGKITERCHVDCENMIMICSSGYVKMN